MVAEPAAPAVAEEAAVTAAPTEALRPWEQAIAASKNLVFGMRTPFMWSLRTDGANLPMNPWQYGRECRQLDDP